MPKFIDITGKTFGKLSVIGISHRNKKLKIIWDCKCECGTIIKVEAYSLKKGQKGCARCSQLKDKKARFFGKVDKKQSCWEWNGFINPEGYGTFNLSGKSILAHRASWIIHNEYIPEGMFICHHCDNKKCVNPEHLYTGTSKDNVRDSLDRGLHPSGPNKKKGSPREKNCKAKLNQEKVEYIKYLCDNGYKKSEVAKFFGVHVVTIRRISGGKGWL